MTTFDQTYSPNLQLQDAVNLEFDRYSRAIVHGAICRLVQREDVPHDGIAAASGLKPALPDWLANLHGQLNPDAEPFKPKFKHECPNCQHAMKSGYICVPCRKRVAEKLKDLEELEQLRVQLAGCATAAQGYIHGEQSVSHGDYGWSPAYDDVVRLRVRYDTFRAAIVWGHEAIGRIAPLLPLLGGEDTDPNIEEAKQQILKIGASIEHLLQWDHEDKLRQAKGDDPLLPPAWLPDVSTSTYERTSTDLRLWVCHIGAAIYYVAAETAQQATELLFECWDREGGIEDDEGFQLESMTKARAKKITYRPTGESSATNILEAAAESDKPRVLACSEWD